MKNLTDGPREGIKRLQIAAKILEMAVDSGDENMASCAIADIAAGVIVIEAFLDISDYSQNEEGGYEIFMRYTRMLEESGWNRTTFENQP